MWKSVAVLRIVPDGLDEDLRAILAEAVDDLVGHPGMGRVGVGAVISSRSPAVQARPAVRHDRLAELART